MKWRCYYGDGSTFDSEDGAPHEAPPLDVACIIYAHREHGRAVVQRWDWYVFRDDPAEPVWGVDIYGLLDLLLHAFPSVRAVKQGRMLTNERYEEIVNRALSDPDFPPKTGWRPTERFEGQR